MSPQPDVTFDMCKATNKVYLITQCDIQTSGEYQGSIGQGKASAVGSIPTTGSYIS
jgi:hypothetical protein